MTQRELWTAQPGDRFTLKFTGEPIRAITGANSHFDDHTGRMVVAIYGSTEKGFERYFLNRELSR